MRIFEQKNSEEMFCKIANLGTHCLQAKTQDHAEYNGEQHFTKRRCVL